MGQASARAHGSYLDEFNAILRNKGNAQNSLEHGLSYSDVVQENEGTHDWTRGEETGHTNHTLTFLAGVPFCML